MPDSDPNHISESLSELNLNRKKSLDEVSSTSSNSSTWILPPEIMIEVFSHLSPNDLDNASLVCRHWNQVVNNEASWRESFSRIFSVARFNRVSSSLKWRTELISRMDCVHKWRKGTSKNLSFNCRITITHLFTDLSAARIIVFASHYGTGLIADPTKGKLAKPQIYTEKGLQLSADVVSVDGSKFGMMYGMRNGGVKALLFSQETRIRDYFTMKEFHTGNVTAAWINKLESPRGTKKIQALTGGEDGLIFEWNIEKGTAKQYALGSGGAAPVMKIECDSRSRVVVGCQDGSIFLKDGEEFVAVGQVPGFIEHFEVDFESDYLVCGTDSGLYRFALKQDSPRDEFSIQYMGISGKITAFAIDKSAFNQTATNKDTPGQYGRYLAASTDTDHVFVWLLQSEADNGKIQPLRTRLSPFQVEDADLPGITAIALNSAVLLLGSYNGVTIAYELLTGEYLRVVSSRFSKRALNYRMGHAANAHGLYPISHLELDEDASNPHGIIVVGSAVQYFDFGATFDDTAERKRGIKKRKRLPMFNSTAFTPTATTKTELNRDIESDIAMMHQEDEELNQQAYNEAGYSDEFNAEGLSEEDQMQLALMLSQEPQAQQPSAQSMPHEEDNFESEEFQSEDEMERAIKMSLQESAPQPSQPAQSSLYEDEDDRELKRALAMSLNDNPSASGSSSTAGEPSSMNHDQMDEDMELAIKLSMQEQ